MSLREADRFKVIQATAEGLLAQWRAAERLNLTTRQVRRLVDRWRMDGPMGLVSRQRGQLGHRQLPRLLEAQARSLISRYYADFGPTLAAEKLRECHGVDLAKETVRRIMIEAGFWVPRRQRPPKLHQQRSRRACLGELVQIDGSDHPWFEHRASACTLLVYVDNATGRLMQLLFVPTETAFAYFAATRAYLERHGKPVAFYSDKFSVFRVNARGATAGRDYTQFGRALYELNIESICANTSQAKGRVERMNGTLQDRLVKELRLRNISTLEDANAFAPVFIADFNQRFAKIPRSDFDAHRPVRPNEDLSRIFTWREWRKVSNRLTLQYDRVLYLVTDLPEHRSLTHRYIEVAEYPDGHIELWADGRSLPYVVYDRLSEIDQGAIVENKRLGRVLEVAQHVQARRDNRRGLNVPSRTLIGQNPRHPELQVPGTKPQRQLSKEDLRRAIDELVLAAPLKGQRVNIAGQACGWLSAILAIASTAALGWRARRRRQCRRRGRAGHDEVLAGESSVRVVRSPQNRQERSVDELWNLNVLDPKWREVAKNHAYEHGNGIAERTHLKMHCD